MKEKATITDIEKRIDDLEFMLSQPMQMRTWSELVSRYHALKIKLCNMRGESPIVLHLKPEHIV